MAKTYTKNTWIDEVLAGAERYDIKENGGAAYKSTMQIVLSTAITQAATALTAALMNNLETGVDTLDTIISRMRSLTTQATAAGTTTLSVTSDRYQEFTGTTTQTIAMPAVSTLVLGDKFTIINSSTGALTVNSSGGNLIATVPAFMTVTLNVILITGTTAASWKVTSKISVGGSAASPSFGSPA